MAVTREATAGLAAQRAGQRRQARAGAESVVGATGAGEKAVVTMGKAAVGTVVVGMAVVATARAAAVRAAEQAGLD